VNRGGMGRRMDVEELENNSEGRFPGGGPYYLCPTLGILDLQKDYSEPTTTSPTLPLPDLDGPHPTYLPVNSQMRQHNSGLLPRADGRS